MVNMMITFCVCLLGATLLLTDVSAAPGAQRDAVIRVENRRETISMTASGKEPLATAGGDSDSGRGSSTSNHHHIVRRHQQLRSSNNTSGAPFRLRAYGTSFRRQQQTGAGSSIDRAVPPTLFAVEPLPAQAEANPNDYRLVKVPVKILPAVLRYIAALNRQQRQLRIEQPTTTIMSM